MSGQTRAEALAGWVSAQLAAVADPDKAGPMAAYMKTDMPFYGVQKPQRRPITRAMKRRFAPTDGDGWMACVRALWALPHREEKYLALAYAGGFPEHLTVAALPLIEQLIREGAWWDLVDETVFRLLSPLALREREALRPVLDRWIDDPSMWIRRAAILHAIRHKADTDPDPLFDYCLRRAHEREFFIRKAIGWALRECGKYAPERVAAFVAAYQDRLSGLSVREATRGLVKAGVWPP